MIVVAVVTAGCFLHWLQFMATSTAFQFAWWVVVVIVVAVNSGVSPSSSRISKVFVFLSFSLIVAGLDQ